LAAKLTGWRIDIKSLTEAGHDSLKMLEHPAAEKAVVENEEFIQQIRYILEKKVAGRPLTAEDFMALNKLVNAVEGQIIAKRAAAHDELRKSRAAAKKRIPSVAWETDLIEFNLIHRTHNVLIQHNITTVGAAMYQLELGDLALLSLDGFGDKALEDLKKAVKEYKDRMKAQRQEKAEEPVVEKVVEKATAVAEPAPAPEPAPTVAAVAQAFNATPVQAAPAPAGGGNSCRHGVMTLRSGVGQKGPWSGYMCAAPKGAPDKCDTIWVR
jgi:N utilization substance protein A